MPSTRRPLPRAAALTAAALVTSILTAPAAAHARPVDTRDRDLSKATTTQLLGDPVYGRDRSTRPFEDDLLDLATTADGHLVAAFVEASKGSQRLIVVVEDGQGGWRVLEDRSYMFDVVADLSLAVADDFPSSAGDDRVYVALELANYGTRYIGLASGSLHQPWKTRAGDFELQFVLELDRDAGVELPEHFSPSHPEVEVFPRPGKDDYAVGIAFEGYQRFEEPPVVEGAEPFVFHANGIYLAFSLDHGQSIGDALHVLGRNAPAPRGPLNLQGDDYFRPDLASDGTNRSLVLSAQDDASGDIYLLNSPVEVAAVTSAQQQRRLNLIEIQSGRPGVQGHSPRVAAAQGVVHLTYLEHGQGRSGGHTARWLSGYPHLAPFLDQQAALHAECASEVDLEVREGTAFLASACYPDQGMAWPVITAFEIATSNGGVTSLLVDDERATSVARSARVTVTPERSRHRQEVTTGWFSIRGLRLQTY